MIRDVLNSLEARHGPLQRGTLLDRRRELADVQVLNECGVRVWKVSLLVTSQAYTDELEQQPIEADGPPNRRKTK